jgi:2-oxoglutarate ferredoxin oxidoreductase subunit alpha
MPYARNDDLARPWIKPGTPGLEHRIGGIEKAPGTGNIDYSPEAHAEMTRIRAAKVAQSPRHPRPGGLPRPRRRELAVVGWGSTFGPIHQAVRRARARGQDVATSTSATSGRCRKICLSYCGLRAYPVPEMNTGQLKTLLRDQFWSMRRAAHQGQRPAVPIAEIEAAIDKMRGGGLEMPRDAVRRHCEHSRRLRRRCR